MIVMRKIKRTKDFELTLDIRNEAFIRPPRDAQRNWVINRALKEWRDDLDALDGEAKEFVHGGEPVDLRDRANTPLADEQIMEDWQIPVMREMVKDVAAAGGDILEIGFGRGAASDFIQSHNIRSHTIVECNDSVIERFNNWRNQHAERDIRLLAGKWQDLTEQFGEYDGVLFHTYPLNEQEFVEYVSRSSTFAEHFFDTAAKALRPGGRFTYLTLEIDSLSRGHQRALLRRFSSFNVRQLKDLNIPEDTRDAQWAQSTVLVCATK